jgi:hypothetical protein
MPDCRWLCHVSILSSELVMLQYQWSMRSTAVSGLVLAKLMFLNNKLVQSVEMMLLDENKSVTSCACDSSIN